MCSQLKGDHLTHTSYATVLRFNKILWGANSAGSLVRYKDHFQCHLWTFNNCICFSKSKIFTRFWFSEALQVQGLLNLHISINSLFGKALECSMFCRISFTKFHTVHQKHAQWYAHAHKGQVFNNNKEMRFNFLTEIKCCLTGQSKYSVDLHLKGWRKQLRCPKTEKAALLLLLASYCLFGNYIKPSSATKVFALGVPGVCLVLFFKFSF